MKKLDNGNNDDENKDAPSHFTHKFRSTLDMKANLALALHDAKPWMKWTNEQFIASSEIDFNTMFPVRAMSNNRLLRAMRNIRSVFPILRRNPSNAADCETQQEYAKTDDSTKAMACLIEKRHSNMHKITSYCLESGNDKAHSLLKCAQSVKDCETVYHARDTRIKFHPVENADFQRKIKKKLKIPTEDFKNDTKGSVLAFLIENQNLGSVVPNHSRIMPHESDNPRQNISLVCNFDNTVRRFTAEYIYKSPGMDLAVAFQIRGDSKKSKYIRGTLYVFQATNDEAKEEIKCLQVVEDFQTAYATNHTYDRRS